MRRGRVVVTLELPSRFDSLDKAGTVVAQLAEVAGFDDDARLDVEIAVHEALINAIVHGNHHDEARHVTLEIVLERPGLEICVRDEGQGFDPTRLPDPLALENLSRASGRGILVIKTFMDAVTFRRSPSAGMEVTMCKRLGPGRDSAPPPGEVGQPCFVAAR